MIFDTLNQACAKFCTPSEHLSVDKAIVKFRGSVIFTYIFPRKEMFLHHNLQILMIQGTHITWVNLGKDAKTATGDVMATHSTVTNLTCKVESVGHKVFMANLFPSPTFLMTWTRKMKWKGKAFWVPTEKPEMEKGWHIVKMQLWGKKEKKSTCPAIWTKHQQGSFYDERINKLKPNIVEHYNEHMGYADQIQWIANNYWMSQHTFKWMTKLFFHLLDRNNSKQYDFDTFIWGSIFSLRFQASLGEKFDTRGKSAPVALEIARTSQLWLQFRTMTHKLL